MESRMKADIQKSQQMASAFAHNIKPKQCYDNIAMVVIASRDLTTRYSGIQVAYGGVQIFPDIPDSHYLYAKHAFFIYQGKALDPTLAMQNKLKETSHFIPIVVYDIPTYREMLSTHKEASPFFIMRKMDAERTALLKQDVILVG